MHWYTSSQEQFLWCPVDVRLALCLSVVKNQCNKWLCVLQMDFWVHCVCGVCFYACMSLCVFFLNWHLIYQQVSFLSLIILANVSFKQSEKMPKLSFHHKSIVRLTPTTTQMSVFLVAVKTNTRKDRSSNSWCETPRSTLVKTVENNKQWNNGVVFHKIYCNWVIKSIMKRKQKHEF